MNIDEERPKNKKLKTTINEKSKNKPKLNEYFEDSLDELKQLYSSNQSIKKEFKKGSFELIESPFKCCVFNEFLNDSKFLDDLRDEILKKVEFFDKDNDLYKFKQSEDLKLLDFDLCNQITKWLRNEILKFIKQLTGVDLYDNQIDVTASKYQFTDTLLCHDDHIEENKEQFRSIAFILYLVDKDWNEQDGGHLDLITKDDNQQPTTTELSLLPKFNSFAFFEVSPSSFHQVREVLSSNKIRLSVNGWFKGPRVYKIKPFKEQFICPIKCKDFFVEEQVLKSWVNNLYLTDEIEKDIRNEFKNESQTLLLDFMDEEKFNKLQDALNDCKEWKLKLPSNRRRYYVLEEANFPEILKEFLCIMKSEQFFLILGQCTGLKLHPLNPDDSDSDDSNDDSDDEECSANQIKKIKKSNPRCVFEIRKFEKGCYTLVHDYDGEILDKNPKLDVKFYLNHPFESRLESGGCTHYIEKNEDTELLTVQPVNNALSLVYRDEMTVRFEKYLNCTHEGSFHELSMIFQE